MKNSNKKGFTLVELLIVIAIISILTALIITNIYSSRGKARDAKRISDIAQLQLALEQYFNKFGVYPDSNNLQTSLVSDYISVLPKDPDSGLTYTYKSSNDKYDYVLSANLEYVNGATADSLPEDPYPDISENISCDPIGLVYCVGPK